MTGGISYLASPETVVIDASVWVSRLLQQDPNHAVATMWTNDHVRNGGDFAAPAILAVEVAASVFRRTKLVADAQGAIGQLQRLSFMYLVLMDNALISDASVIAANVGLRGADAIYVALARQLGFLSSLLIMNSLSLQLR